MLNKKYLLLAFLLLPLGASAQQALDYTETEPVYEAGGRVGVGAEFDLVPKILTLSVDEQLRFNENFEHFQRSYSTLGLEYKVLPWLKAGVSASYILNNSASKGWTTRYRAAFALTESFKLDRWKFSLREKLQATYYADSINLYQSPKTALVLKTRIKAAYDIPNCKFTPYASAELRNTLNAVNPAGFTYSASSGRWSNTSPVYNDIYINRLRLIAGTTYKTRSKNELDMYLFADLKWDLDIDFNSEGYQKVNKKASGYKDYLFLTDSYLFGIGVSYTFKL